MNKKIKIIILSLCITFSVSMQSFSLSYIENNSSQSLKNDAILNDNYNLEYAFKNIELNDYDINKMNSLEKEVFNELLEYSFDESNLEYTDENKEIVLSLLNENNNLGTIFSENNNIYFRSSTNSKKPKVRIKNNHAAAAFNTIIGAVLGGITGKAGTVAMNALIDKMGKKAAINLVKNKALSQIKNKLIYWGMNGTASKVSSFLGTALYNLLDPGTALAKLLDKNDRWGANGYIEV